MNYRKISVTIPGELYEGLKEIAARKQSKLSHVVAEAIAEKLARIEEDIYLQRVNSAFEDPEIIEEQKAMADLIVESTDVKELPW